jgi:hypothetical protein
MNHRPHEHDRDRDDAMPIDGREWALQEQALEDERRGMPPTGDPRRLRYRVLARRLRALPDAALPSNFAWETAQAVERRARAEARAFARFRRRLYGAFALVYASCMLLVVALSGIDAVLPLRGGPSLRWVVALFACVGVSLLLGEKRGQSDFRATRARLP